ncbi:MAG: hypothetical protein J4N31_02335 [Chloroflexi bacterium]|nr:hypothetical protein [Chloroflexota bacterium]MCI0815853.1 hypothetical protein [Chloroflexota bacterium]MCI0821155.1 hypothetical protein [Chloroflexota bacterium]MCI0888039.1 hypothetical protein [Chloroflexota bacterium]
MAHQRYEREIEEILGQVNEEAPAAKKSRRGPRRATSEVRPAGPRLRPPTLDFSSGRLFLIGAALLVGSLVLTLVGFAFAAPFAWVGIGLFIVAYLRFFTKPRRNVDRMWRGQSIEDPPSPSAPSRLWRWITGR